MVMTTSPSSPPSSAPSAGSARAPAASTPTSTGGSFGDRAKAALGATVDTVRKGAAAAGGIVEHTLDSGGMQKAAAFCLAFAKGIVGPGEGAGKADKGQEPSKSAIDLSSKPSKSGNAAAGGTPTASDSAGVVATAAPKKDKEEPGGTSPS